MVVKESSPKIIKYLKKRNILKQYEKAKSNLELGHFSLVNLKKRQPRSLGIYSFRINEKFRCFCVFIEGELIVSSVSAHQEK